MMLVYNLPAAEALFSDGLHTRFVGLNGSAYVVGGFGFTAAMYDEMVVVPIRTGVGARLGVNVGYLSSPLNQPGTRSEARRLGPCPTAHALAASSAQPRRA
jgi:hypothetical protein